MPLCLPTPVAGRKEPAGVEGFGRATSVSCSWGGQGGRGRGQHGLPEEGSRNQEKEASPDYVLIASTNEHWRLDKKSSKAPRREPSVARDHAEEGTQ